MQDNLKRIVKFLMVIAALFVAPALVPVLIIALMVILTVAGGVLGLCVIFCTAVSPVFLGIFAGPLLVGSLVTLSVYVLLTIGRGMIKKTEKLCKSFVVYNKLVDILASVSIIKALTSPFKMNSTGERQNCSFQEPRELEMSDSWANILAFEAAREEESRHTFYEIVRLMNYCSSFQFMAIFCFP